jgi:nitroreductase
MKGLLKKILPESVKRRYRKEKKRWDWLTVIKDFIYDYKRYIKFSATTGLRKKEQMRSFLIKEYHAIEKGLALRNVKVGFGLERISELIDVFLLYIHKYGKDTITDITIATLKEYLDFDKQHNDALNPISLRIEEVLSKYGFKQNVDCKSGGTKKVVKSEILRTLNFDYGAFIKSRYSTRDFSDKPVDKDILLDALDIARFTPSVCNRQAWKVYVIDHTNPHLKSKFLNVQNGNRGFGEHISTLLVITGKLSSFFSYERNQIFIDGGMFAMSLVLALHSKGIGTCCLNTSYTAEKNKAFLKVTKLDEDCVPIMFIGIGNLKDEYRVAVSQRKPVEEIVSIL